MRLEYLSRPLYLSKKKTKATSFIKTLRNTSLIGVPVVLKRLVELVYVDQGGDGIFHY